MEEYRLNDNDLQIGMIIIYKEGLTVRQELPVSRVLRGTTHLDMTTR